MRGIVGYGLRRTVRDPVVVHEDLVRVRVRVRVRVKVRVRVRVRVRVPVIVHEYRAAVLAPPLTVALVLEGEGIRV